MYGMKALVETLDPDRPIVVQAHDFPDHDAVGTAYALAELLKRQGLTVRLGYGGTIQSESLRDAISALEIDIQQIRDLELDKTAQLIVVDGFAGNSNMTGSEGEVVAVIDHHPTPYPADCAYADIRDEYGACSTILYDYYRTAGVPLNHTVATALLMGLMMDTAFMTRGVADIDLEAFGVLFRQGDWELAARLLRNSLSLGDLAAFRQAIDACVIARNFAFVALQGEYSAEVMALIADFFLKLREIQFVVVVSGERDEHRLSVRSEAADHPCDVVIHGALQGIGAGGGHIHMGGGAIPRDLYPGDEGLRKRFIVALGFDKKEDEQETNE
jgi:nanoRNase/pAp phosphatase (c-di-AMP/oligoRNAs hydrolase)